MSSTAQEPPEHPLGHPRDATEGVLRSPHGSGSDCAWIFFGICLVIRFFCFFFVLVVQLGFVGDLLGFHGIVSWVFYGDLMGFHGVTHGTVMGFQRLHKITDLLLVGP